MINQLLTILPPDLFPPEMQPLIYFTVLPLMVLIAFIGAVIILVVYIVAPIEAKIHLWNKLKGLPLMDHETNEGVRILEPIKSYGQGINIGTKTGNIYILPQPIGMDTMIEEIQPELDAITSELIKLNDNEKNKERKLSEEQLKPIIVQQHQEYINQTIKQVRDMERELLRPSICKGSRVPIWRSYGSKAIGVKLAHLVGLMYDGTERETRLAIPLSVKTGKQIEPVKLFFDNGKPTHDKWILPVSLPVDSAVLKKWFPKMWNPSQIAGLKQTCINIGARQKQKTDKMMIYLLIALAGIVGILGFVIGMLAGGG